MTSDLVSTEQRAEFRVLTQLMELAHRLESLAHIAMSAAPGLEATAYKQLIVENGQQIRQLLEQLENSSATDTVRCRKSQAVAATTRGG